MKTPNQDTTALDNYAGTYSKDLIGQLLQDLEITSQVKVIYNVTAPLNLTKLLVKGGIRPLDTAIDKAAKPGRVWSKRTLTPHVGMKIFEVIPEELRKTWMSEQLDPNATDVPFAQWVWEQEFAVLAEEISDNLFYMEYHGEEADFDATVVYNPGDYFVYGELRYIYKVITLTTAGQTPLSNPAKFKDVTAISLTDGPGTIIAKDKLSGKLPAGNVIATNVITATNAVAELRKVYLGAPNPMRKKKNGKMYVSVDVMENYKQDYDTRYGKGNGLADNTEDADVVYLKGTSKRVQLVEASWMNDSQMVIYTLADNFLMGTNRLSDQAGIGKRVETLHGFKAICKWILCFQFADTDVLYVNDKA